MAGKIEKVDASKVDNFNSLQKYSKRFGYIIKNENSIKTFSVKLDNRLEGVFGNFYDYSPARKVAVRNIFHLLGKEYAETEDRSWYNA